MRDFFEQGHSMLENHRDTEIAASPLAAASKDADAIQPQLKSPGIHCVLINFTQPTTLLSVFVT